MLTAGLIQQANEAGTEANKLKIAANIALCAQKGAKLIVLQELQNSLYFCQTEDTVFFDLAETIPGSSTDFYAHLALKHEVVLVVTLFEKRSAGLYHNTAVVFEKDGTIAGKYRKMHIPDDPAYYEKFYFTPGDLGFDPIQTSVGKLGVLICWDQWYPEAARITSLLGAEIIFYPTAIGWAASQPDDLNRLQYQAWQTIQRGHAIANGVFVVSVNRTGNEGEMKFWGGSFVSDPFGEVLYEAPHDREEIHVQELDLARIGEIRVHWPFLRDRRIDSYGPILNRYIDN